VYAARLLVSRAEVTGDSDDANVKIEIVPKGKAEALKLIGPRYDSFDAAEAVRAFVGRALELSVKDIPKWEPDKTQLEIVYEGKPAQAPPAVQLEVKALHRAGQTFITWKEIDNPLADKPVALRDLQAAERELAGKKSIVYRVLRLARPIDADTAAEAQHLGDVRPFSGFNVRGVSLDRLIYQHQLRAIDDALFARSIAPGPFGGYNTAMPQMGEVVVERLAVEDGRPLPPATGLYVHNPDKAGKAYYAVVPIINGEGAFSAGSAAKDAVEEEVGAGAPVMQDIEDLKAFYDYPGERRHYVQWCAPPLANLPNQYYNWGVYVPPSPATRVSETRGRPPAVKFGLGIYFHDWQPLFLRPRWPHRQDMVLLSPHDHPYPSFGYGYHESLGTLRPFTEGAVQDYTARRIDAFVEWVKKNYRIDEARLSTHGMGTLGGTSALHYGLRHAAKMSWIVAGTYDPDPKTNAPSFKVDNYPVRKTHLSALQAIWGKKEWDLKTAGGASIWKDRDLTAFVLANPKLDLPFLSLGSGSMHPTWVQENAFLKALLAAHQPFWTGFWWGGEPPRFGPLYLRRDCVYLAASAPEDQIAQTVWGKDNRWQKGAVGYWSGGEINTGLGWKTDDVVDTPDRLEVTVTGGGSELAVRNAQAFKTKPGESIHWEMTGTGARDNPKGDLTADANGLVVLKGVNRGRLVLTRAGANPPAK
jgi:hypothetical protein